MAHILLLGPKKFPNIPAPSVDDVSDVHYFALYPVRSPALLQDHNVCWLHATCGHFPSLACFLRPSLWENTVSAARAAVPCDSQCSPSDGRGFCGFRTFSAPPTDSFAVVWCTAGSRNLPAGVISATSAST